METENTQNQNHSGFITSKGGKTEKNRATVANVSIEPESANRNLTAAILLNIEVPQSRCEAQTDLPNETFFALFLETSGGPIQTWTEATLHFITHHCVGGKCNI